MTINLEQMALKELRDLKVRVEKAISTYEDRRKQEALVELEEVAQKMGFSLADLTGISVAKKRKPAEAKYANPADSSETWTGRGRKPRWVQAALESGKSLEDLAI
ncbi:H-NS histone family protein [Phaeovulum sp. W22_SRMD_FR3]|uniref:H-NS histone family protein n=1 Tax=Phaeovulum sp. W22_SRMD_FR3 TaxID=3240274 RepID=UPI003F96CD1B